MIAFVYSDKKPPQLSADLVSHVADASLSLIRKRRSNPNAKHTGAFRAAGEQGRPSFCASGIKLALHEPRFGNSYPTVTLCVQAAWATLERRAASPSCQCALFRRPHWIRGWGDPEHARTNDPLNAI